MLEMMTREAREEEKGYLHYMYKGFIKMKIKNDEEYFAFLRKEGNGLLSGEEYEKVLTQYLKREMMYRDAAQEYANKVHGWGYSREDYRNSCYVYSIVRL